MRKKKKKVPNRTELENIFYIKNFIKEKSGLGLNALCIQDLFETAINEIEDNKLIEILILTGNIPDEYVPDSEEEKLFTKMIEILGKECLSRIGSSAECVKQKSNYQDITITINDKIVVCDSKSFRLSRSQPSPNVKDFIKHTDYKNWLNRYPEEQQLGGLVIYPCVHEWKSTSQVYHHATDFSLPIVMLPYKYLAYLLKYKNNFNVDELETLWDYESIFPEQSKNKDNYWKNMNIKIKSLTKTNDDDFAAFMTYANNKINSSINEHEKLITKSINVLIKDAWKKIENLSLEQLQNLFVKEIHKDEIEAQETKLSRLKERYYK